MRQANQFTMAIVLFEGLEFVQGIGKATPFSKNPKPSKKVGFFLFFVFNNVLCGCVTRFHALHTNFLLIPHSVLSIADIFFSYEKKSCRFHPPFFGEHEVFSPKNGRAERKRKEGTKEEQKRTFD